MIVAVHAMAHIAINCVPINWNLPVSFGMFRRAERAEEQRQVRPVTAQDLECTSLGKEHRIRRRGKSYPDKAVKHGQIYKRCNDFLEEALQTALADETAYPIAAKTESPITSVNSPTLDTKETLNEVAIDTSVSVHAEQADSGVSDGIISSASDEAVIEDEGSCTDESVSEGVFDSDGTASHNSTPAASPWVSLQPETPIKTSLVSAKKDQCNSARTNFSIKRKENGEVDITGKGTFGSVYRGNYRGKEVAIKLTGVPTFRKETEGQVFARVGIHSNVIRLHTFYHDGFGADKVETLILDYATTDLHRLVRAVASEPKRKMSLDYVAFVADCLANALAHIHQRGYAHLDVSPGNVLMMCDGVPKLADFSSSLRWKIGDRPLEVYPVGTLGFRAPEIIERLGYDTGADWFSLGVLIYYMINARLPWARNDNDQMAFIRKEMSHLVDELPESFASLISDLLADIPNDRITEDVLSFLANETEL